MSTYGPLSGCSARSATAGWRLNSTTGNLFLLHTGRRVRSAMGGLVGYGAYIPYHRLERSRIADALSPAVTGGAVTGGGGGPSTRSVAAYDEDTTSMAVEAGRAALAA